jgi:hypothetical protein
LYVCDVVGVGVNVGVILMVGVIDGVMVGVGVNVGVILMVGVIDGVEVMVGVGVGEAHKDASKLTLYVLSQQPSQSNLT